jgi:hypothetical protein
VNNLPVEKAGGMDDFVIQRNIRRFEKQLQCESDAAQRGMIRQLLSEELAKLATLQEARGGDGCDHAGAKWPL